MDDTTNCLAFELGALAATAGAAQAAATAGVRLVDMVLRHLGGDWGDLDDDDKAANARAVANGGRILSSYHLDTGEDIWVLTEADRSSTTVLLASEY
jgi:hypothetical protein